MKKIVALLLGCALTLGTLAPALADEQEDQIGQQVYQELANKGEIISQSPYYNVLGPIATRIKRVADSQYDRPFRFILVHEKQPNAFAVPGGNVYVTDSLMRFVQNTEELAGVLCHETSHTIHHDVVNNMAKDQRAQVGTTLGAIALGAILGKGATGMVNTLGNVYLTTKVQGFSREVETAADLKGSDTCAQSGYNPYGMIWLFEQFAKANTGGGSFEALSDHPRDDHRISDLESHFAANPSVFGRFSSSIASATPLPSWVRNAQTGYRYRTR